MVKIVLCVLCKDEFVLKYEVVKIGKNFVCTGCAEALHYAFRKGCLNPEVGIPPLKEEPKDWIAAMEWRLAGKPKIKRRRGRTEGTR